MLVLALILNVVDVVLFLDARACHGAWAALYLAVAQVILLYWLVEELTKRGLFSAAIRGALAWMALVLIVAGWFLVAKSQETPRPYVGILVTIAAWAPLVFSSLAMGSERDPLDDELRNTCRNAQAAARRPQPRRLRMDPMIRQTR